MHKTFSPNIDAQLAHISFAPFGYREARGWERKCEARILMPNTAVTISLALFYGEVGEGTERCGGAILQAMVCKTENSLHPAAATVSGNRL
jgi:hypothetical protein